MSNFKLRDVIHSYKYALNDEEKTVKPKTRSKVAKPSINRKKIDSKITDRYTKQDHDLKDLPPSVKPGLTLVFVGFNPGVESSKKQHHYAHPTNLFWKLFNALDILSVVLDIRNVSVLAHGKLISEIYCDGKSQARAEHDFKLLDLGIGFTDLVLRCTKQASELSLHEKAENVPRLLKEFEISQAPFIVFIGKGIWEVVCKYLVPKHRLNAHNFSWGLQKDLLVMLRFNTFCLHRPEVYVFPNTSGLVALMKYPQKLDLWQNLVADMRKIPDSENG
ncbi:DNA glycosylase [Metschnikowia bicuspidata var. bicuspidata NRRL YB-4993]|uniref:DNA glycosylase n=1 Tax=Metschnikowia bicuspidata var. bicuspidata NRRL YB-4993 TaxID=869754 RepID=A0A1A0HHP6_9ASCO|nr:DNA glycosylase [Metschnikowia bicuspidata var. bicuspidata NRRL YB-4993]OBA23530.1 DNA glycosylase [Metschnikowia bicuspidata var. bicuspidata NRRL YB-4993]